MCFRQVNALTIPPQHDCQMSVFWGMYFYFNIHVIGIISNIIIHNEHKTTVNWFRIAYNNNNTLLTDIRTFNFNNNKI